jgi:hypothetical protein
LDQPLFHTNLLTEISYETPHGKSLEKASSFPQKVLSTSNRDNSCREDRKETSSDSKSTLRTTLSLSEKIYNNIPNHSACRTVTPPLLLLRITGTAG